MSILTSIRRNLARPKHYQFMLEVMGAVAEVTKQGNEVIMALPACYFKNQPEDKNQVVVFGARLNNRAKQRIQVIAQKHRYTVIIGFNANIETWIPEN